MLLPMADLLHRAKTGEYGIPAVCAVDESTFRAAVQAAEERHAPLITLCMAKESGDLEELMCIRDSSTAAHAYNPRLHTIPTSQT